MKNAALVLVLGALAGCYPGLAPFDMYGWVQQGDFDEDGYAYEDGDCDDADASVNPGAVERCNGVDDDCSGVVDDDPTDGVVVYPDADGDQFGVTADSEVQCEPAEGWVVDGGDCDDVDPDVNPGAEELCNGTDDDCNELIDDEPLDGTVFYGDGDGDDYGDDEVPLLACELPEGAAAEAGDCDDGDADVFPGAPEVCNGEDDDCDGVPDDGLPADAWYFDGDSDGFGDPETETVDCAAPAGNWVEVADDCNDADSTVYLGAEELCDKKDNDCDELIDESAPVWWRDADGDGYGVSSDSVEACEAPSGYVDDDLAEDCDDVRVDVNPGAPEICDGVDNDCVPVPYEADASDASTWYADTDGDEYGDALAPALACFSAPPDHVADASDCDDTRGDVYPGAPEYCGGVDHDCDTLVDESESVDATTWYADTDGDGEGAPLTSTVACDAPTGFVGSAGDCDDAEPAVYEGAPEVCDGLDNDCDTLVDDADPVVDSPLVWHRDADGDGYGQPLPVLEQCSEPAGYADNASDCDDGRPDVNPAADELCSTAWDDDCDGFSNEDDAVDAPEWYFDADGDGWGVLASPLTACEQPLSYVDASRVDDCNDGAATIHPEAEEACDGVDRDCDGDGYDPDSLDAVSVWPDVDGDGYGDELWVETSCPSEVPSGYLFNGEDCDDLVASTYPGAPEYCDAVDSDCDDEARDPDSEDALVFYVDGDGDGYGDSASPLTACDQPSGTSAVDGDCADGEATRYPGAAEYCNGADDDCDLATDEPDAEDALEWYADVDGDGYGDASSTAMACFAAPTGYVGDAADCDDVRLDIYPGAPEYCDGEDTDCDLDTDDPESVDASAWWFDGDGDGYGTSEDVVLACATAVPSGYVAPSVTDCDDTTGLASPGIATETCNDGLDNNCDGTGSPCALPASVALADAEGVYVGEAGFDVAGASVTGGDLDGDGDAEVVIGAYDNGPGGTVYVLGLAGGSAEGSFDLGSDHDARVTASTSQQLGWSVAVGDLDGDGVGELIAGAPSAGGFVYGAVYIFEGVEGAATTADAAVTLNGSSVALSLGSSVSSGHVAAGAAADLIVGAVEGTASGKVYLFADPLISCLSCTDESDATTTFSGEALGDEAGAAVANVGDVDGDGWEDVLVGAPGAALGTGAAYLLTSDNWSAYDAKYSGTVAGDAAGTSVAGGGDLDGDGRPDLVVGAPGFFSGRGVVYIKYGSATPSDTPLSIADVSIGGAIGDAAGTAATIAGDLDADGVDDLLVSAPARSGTGVVGVFYGGAFGATLAFDVDADVYITGESSGDAAGSALWGGGDVNGDTNPDLLIGAPGSDAGGVDAGAAYLVLGQGI